MKSPPASSIPEGGTVGYSATSGRPRCAEAIPEPQDAPYPGIMQLHVDATDVERGIFRVRQTMPAPETGPLILLYPKWLPGFHSPQAPIELFAGLQISADARQLGWRRHPVTVNAFHIDVPEGTMSIEVAFQFLSPTESSQGRIICSPDLLMLPWNNVLLYPAGYYARQIMVEPELRLPDGWQAACALAQEHGLPGQPVRFETSALDVLVDSPVLAGRHFRREPLDDHVTLTIVADQAHLLSATPDQIAAHRAVVDQADRLFRSRPFDRFEMLLALSDTLSAEGIEHHRSFEAVSVPEYFTAWDANLTRHDTIPHEYVHSWNGKHRRGADSWTPNFETPIRNSLMWVYEGLTQYWTHVLAARSGMWGREQVLGALAYTAARYDARPGSHWRPLIDTTRDPIIAARSPLPWPSWQRSEDYYSEGALIWLDVDTRLRELSGETRSLDDFARIFFACTDGDFSTRPYRFEDVVEALDGIAAFGWKDFFDGHLEKTHAHTPLDGIRRGGYRLVYRDHPTAYQSSYEANSGMADLTHAVGLTVSTAGRITDVLWEGPAFDAGLTIGAQITAVGDRGFSLDQLRLAIREAAERPVEITVTKGKSVRNTAVVATAGLRFPHLERCPTSIGRLDAILDPLPN